MIAHVGGMPVEEVLAPLVSGAAVGLMFARSWISARVRRARDDRLHESDRALR